MSSLLTLIVLGLAYFYSAVPTVLSSATNSSIQSRQESDFNATHRDSTYTEDVGVHEDCAQNTDCSKPLPIECSAIPGNIQQQFQVQAKGYNYTYTPGVGAHRLHSKPVTWNTARRICEEQEGHLVIINSIAEAELIGQLLNNSDLRNSWIGVHDFYQEDEFVTIHGESLAQTGYDVWHTGEPNNVAGEENCVVVRFTGKLNDVPCNHLHKFICELPYVQPYVLQVPGHLKTSWVIAAPEFVENRGIALTCD